MRVAQFILLFLVGGVVAQESQRNRGLRKKQKSLAEKEDPVWVWTAIAIECIRQDFSGEEDAVQDQGSPAKAARALAIVQIAIFDAVNCIMGNPEKSFLVHTSAKGNVHSAVASAAVITLKALFPSQVIPLDAQYNTFIASLDCSLTKLNKGIEVGELSAHAAISSRQDDGSDANLEYVPSGNPGNHIVDPFNPLQGYADPQFAFLRPFVMETPSQFRAVDHPCLDLTSEDYAREFNLVKSVGAQVSETRTHDQLLTGIYWAYDGAKGLGVPIRQLMQIALQVTQNMGLTSLELARVYALCTVAAADTAISSWDSKYHYSFWRPVVAIHEADSDGNDNTEADTSWEPFGAPKSNVIAEHNFTPNFPTYTSGHSQFSGSFFLMLKLALGHDVAFTFVSDELNGITTDRTGVVREKHERSFATLGEAAEEMAYSRVYLGIHWECDCAEGLGQGEKIAQYVFDKVGI